LRHDSARTEALRFAFRHGLGVPLRWVGVSPAHRPWHERDLARDLGGEV